MTSDTMDIDCFRTGLESIMDRLWIDDGLMTGRGGVDERGEVGGVFGGTADVLLAVAGVKNTVAKFAGNGTDSKNGV